MRVEPLLSKKSTRYLSIFVPDFKVVVADDEKKNMNELRTLHLLLISICIALNVNESLFNEPPISV